MDNREMNKALRDRARELGLCDKWHDEWDKDCTRQELIGKYIRGIDFCIKHDYPKLDFIREYFPKKQLNDNGVFVDDKIDGHNLRDVVMLGDSHGQLRYEGFCTGNVYVRHHSGVDIQATEGARVFVELYDDGVVTASADDVSRVFVYQHGGSVKVSGNVTVRDKRK